MRDHEPRTRGDFSTIEKTLGQIANEPSLDQIVAVDAETRATYA